MNSIPKLLEAGGPDGGLAMRFDAARSPFAVDRLEGDDNG